MHHHTYARHTSCVLIEQSNFWLCLCLPAYICMGIMTFHVTQHIVALPMLRRPSAASPSLAVGSRWRFGMASAGAGRAMIQVGAPAMRAGPAWEPGRAVQVGAPAMRVGTAAAVARAPGWAPGRAVQVGAPAMWVGAARAPGRAVQLGSTPMVAPPTVCPRRHPTCPLATGRASMMAGVRATPTQSRFRA